jgi:hypothetical protein
MKRILTSLAALALLAGCVDYDQLNSTSFTRTAAGFEFRAVATPQHKLDDPVAESWRLGFLENDLEARNLCTGGYTIAQRTPTLTDHTAAGDSYDVRYEGACK